MSFGRTIEELELAQQHIRSELGNSYTVMRVILECQRDGTFTKRLVETKTNNPHEEVYDKKFDKLHDDCEYIRKNPVHTQWYLQHIFLPRENEQLRIHMQLQDLEIEAEKIRKERQGANAQNKA